MPVQIVARDNAGNWIPKPAPEVIQDGETGIWSYKNSHEINRSRAIGEGSFADTPWWLNLSYDEKVTYIKARIAESIDDAKKGARFDRVFSVFLSIWSKFIPYVGGIAKKAVVSQTSKKGQETDRRNVTEQITHGKTLLNRSVERARAFERNKQKKITRKSNASISNLIYSNTKP